MRKKLQIAMIVLGTVVLLGGLIGNWLGINHMLPVPRPDLVVYGTTLTGILLVLLGSAVLVKPDKEQEILEKDERNIAISHGAYAIAYGVTVTLLGIAFFALVFTGYMNKVVAFTLAGILVIGQLTWFVSVYYLDQRM